MLVLLVLVLLMVVVLLPVSSPAERRALTAELWRGATPQPS